jgi:PAS domain S-box-containing protein
VTDVDEVESAQVERLGQMLPVPFTMLRPDGTSVWCNHAYCDMVGLSLDQVLDRSLGEAVHPDDMMACDEAVARAISGEPVDVQLRTLHADGHWLYVRWGFGRDRPSGQIAAVALNVTDDQAQAQVLRHEASHDSLTGLVNRAEVLRRLKELAHDPEGVTVAIIDLDRFKMINDR